MNSACLNLCHVCLKYSGVWYEYGRTSNPFEKDLSCVTATYTYTSDSTVNVQNYGLNLYAYFRFFLYFVLILCKMVSF